MFAFQTGQSDLRVGIFVKTAGLIGKIGRLSIDLQNQRNKNLLQLL